MSAPPAALQLWGGVECSVVRLGDAWRDQVCETGHHDREGDLGYVAELGIRTLRYPVLWERCAPGNPVHCGWAWHDQRMDRLRSLGITPILGLLHHGAGPQAGGLLEPGLGTGLAAHAGAAAQRYPDMTWWTPVNEPLTTARFACLYGHWHPHGNDEAAFLRAVVNQCYAALLAMRAIRRHVPHARFLHTEDIGRVFSTTAMARQAAYENERRWLSLDLLTGKVDRAHPWRSRFDDAAVNPGQLDELASGEARPDVIGVNHYVTSDRFLDHRQDMYARHLRSSDPRIRYVDTEAARVFLPEGDGGWLGCLRETWQRYACPMVVSEAHLGCIDPFEQVRWLVQAWEAAQQMQLEGADVRAVTVWAMFGLVDWDSMLRERRGRYEPGVFDTSGGAPHPTLLAEAASALARTGRFEHPALLEPGWWERDTRVPAAPKRA